MSDLRDMDKFHALSAETLIMMREDLILSIAINLQPEDERVCKVELKLVEDELDRRTRGGMASIHALMGYVLEEVSNV